MIKWKKITPEQFETFKKYCEAWRQTLGLTKWAVYYQLQNDRSSYGQTRWDIEGGVATVLLSREWDEFREINDKELNSLALHEMLHLFIAHLVNCAESRYTTQSEIDIVEHEVIRKLEYVILESEHAKV